MNTIEIALLLPYPTGASTPFATPFGEVYIQPHPGADRAIALIEPGADPRSGPWAARALGAQRLVAVGTAGSLNRLLRPYDWLVPDDYLDQTRGLPTTYFTGRGLGYVPQLPAFCPELHAALACAPENRESHVLPGGALVGTNGPRLETPAEARWWQRLGGDAAGWGILPAVTLARELELCVAAACYITRQGGGADTTWLEPVQVDRLIAALAAELPTERACRCHESMAAARARAGLEDDWWKTLAP